MPNQFYLCTQRNILQFTCCYYPCLNKYVGTNTFTNELYEDKHIVIPAYRWLPLFLQRWYIKMRLIWNLDIFLLDYNEKWVTRFYS